jgi:hypothetical protein
MEKHGSKMGPRVHWKGFELGLLWARGLRDCSCIDLSLTYWALSEYVQYPYKLSKPHHEKTMWSRVSFSDSFEEMPQIEDSG